MWQDVASLMELLLCHAAKFPTRFSAVPVSGPLVSMRLWPVSPLARKTSSLGRMSADFIQRGGVVGGVSHRETLHFAEHFELRIQEKSKWQLSLCLRWRALSHFFCCLQGEKGYNKSQKIWFGCPAALPFSLKGKRISQLLEKKLKSFPKFDRSGNNNIYVCETIARLTCCLWCVCYTCWTACLREVPEQAEGQAMARG